MTGGPGAPYPYLPPYQLPEAQHATPAMVLGIISLCGVLPLACCCGIGTVVVIPMGIAAVAFGLSARSKIAASRGALGGEGKALAGMITGATAAAIAIVIFVIVLIFGLSMSGVGNRIPTP